MCMFNPFTTGNILLCGWRLEHDSRIIINVVGFIYIAVFKLMCGCRFKRPKDITLNVAPRKHLFVIFRITKNS